MLSRATRTLAAGTLAAGLFSAILAPATAHATTIHPDTTTRRHVCAQDVYLRETPAGVTIGLLDQGDTFDQESLSPSGEWAYGMAYGSANKHGWVMESALC